MLSRIDHGGVIWIDAHNPSPEEILKISREFALPKPISEEISRPSFHPKAENHDGKIYVILPLPLFDHKQQFHHSRELDIVIGEKFIFTVHFEPIDPLQKVFDLLDHDLKLRNDTFKDDTHRIYIMLWKKLYDHLLDELDHIQKKIDRIEDKIFSVERKEIIEEISLLRRDVLDFFRSLSPHKMVIDDFKFIARNILKYNHEGINEISQSYERILFLAENNRDSLEVLYDTYNALQNRRSSDTMQIFTMLALLTFPLTLIAAIFAVETKDRPIVGHPHDFWILVSIMVLVAFSMLIYFKSKKWL